MDQFLKVVSQHAIKKHANSLHELTVVFPNRRAALFFQKYIGELETQPVLSPRLLTISDLVATFTKLSLADPISLIIDLHPIFCEKTGKDEPLDDFYYWGEMLLSDFNEIDKYLVDAQQLFKNIESLKEIDMGYGFLEERQLGYLSTFWEHILQSKDSKSKTYFLSVWNKLYAVYHDFNCFLKNKGIAYEGLLYRNMTELLTGFQEEWAGKPIFFVGFNALNACEKKLFRFLQNHANASFLWDYDPGIIEQENHEAGFFMRQNLLEFPPPFDFEVLLNDRQSKLKEMEVVSITGNTGQTVYVSEWLKSNEPLINNRFDNTALVLCDERLLLPVLPSLPEFFNDINITMGFPFRASAVYGLVKSIADLEKNGKNGKNPDEKIYYYRHILSTLGHPLLNQREDVNFDKYYHEIIKGNIIYLNTDYFIDNPFLYNLFRVPDSSMSCRTYLQNIISELITDIPEPNLIEKETLHLLYLTVNKLHNSLFGANLPDKGHVSARLFFQLLLKQLDSLTIPFEGEPLKGLQVIGFLETRCLDFENLVFISASDNNLPGNAHRNSFIPYNLRRGFGLPLAEHRQAMYAYYFYRLLQRAQKVSLVYDNRREGLSRGEVTRYVNQIRYGEQALKIIDKNASFAYEPTKETAITIEKTGKNLEALERFLNQNMISPTAINTFLDCSLKFFFHYIEGIKEPDEMVEKIDNLIFGRVAHKAIEILYRPMLGQVIGPEWLDALLHNGIIIEQALNQALDLEYFKGTKAQLTGSNLLASKIIGKYLEKIIQYDRSVAPFKLLALEKEYKTLFEIEANGKKQVLCLGGTIDRIDLVGEELRIVDYKTGVSATSLTKFTDLYQGNNRNKAAFQTLFYAYCFYENEKPILPVKPAVYGARAVFSDVFSPEFFIEKNPLVFQSFRLELLELLNNILEQIVQVDSPFVQTEITERCSYCPYNIICNR